MRVGFNINNSTARKNPYIIGHSIDELKLLFRRQDLFCLLEDNFSQELQAGISVKASLVA
jgi:hypothetical protein